MNKIILAIDPGASGGLAWHDGEAVHSKAMPDTEGDVAILLDELREHGDVEVFLELVGGFVGRPQAGSHMFAFGRNFGFFLGVCAGAKLPLRLVRPQEWQKSAKVGSKGSATDNEWKNKLKAEAQRRYPGHKVTLKTADALLILDWARGQDGKD